MKFYNCIKSRLDKINWELNQKLPAWVGDCHLSGCVVLVAFTCQCIYSNRSKKIAWGEGKETAIIYVRSTLVKEGGKRQSHQKLFKIARCFSNSTFHQGWCTVTSDHKIGGQSILQGSITLILRRLSYAWFLQAKGTLHGSNV